MPKRTTRRTRARPAATRNGAAQAAQEELARLRAADRAKNEFLAVLAHELRHPLAPIRNATRVLQIAPPASSDSTAALEIIERQLGQLTRLVDDLLEVTRITSNKLELRRQDVDLADVVRLGVETCAPQIEARGLDLMVDVPRESVRIHADPARLAQVLTNLIDNAGKFTPAPGRVRVTAGLRDGDAWIAVEDTGIGISREALSGIFDLFAQGEPALGRSSPGLGIGLSVVRTLVLMHGGSVIAHSEGPGKGSTFEVRLPAL